MVEAIDRPRSALVDILVPMTIDLLLREAGNYSASRARLAELALHRSVSVREMVAGNPSLGQDTIEKLARDDAWRVRAAAATRPELSDATLLALASDAKDQVRWATVENAATRPSVITTLAASPDRLVRQLVAHHNRAFPLPHAVQAALAEDESPDTRGSIAASTQYRDVFANLLRDPDPQTRGRCAENERATREDFELLLADSSRVTRRTAVAIGVIFPDDEQLIRLARDRSADVRWHVVFRVDAPREALQIIADEDDEMNSRHALSALRDPRAVNAGDAIEQARRRRVEAASTSAFI